MTNREIDALIAEKIFGLKPFQEKGEQYSHGQFVRAINDYRENGEPVYVFDCACYTSDIAAAMEVADQFDGFELKRRQDSMSSPWFYSCFLSHWGDDMFADGRADTAALAICLTALRCKGIELKSSPVKT